MSRRSPTTCAPSGWCRTICAIPTGCRSACACCATPIACCSTVRAVPASSPGELRRSQNWIGGTRPGNAAFVPPPPERVASLLGDLERFIHDAARTLPPLVRIALVHAQFETIHPFLDGNGRIGRLLIAALLEHWGLLPEPLMYLSGYLKQHQAEYYRRLSAIRTDGDWEAWVALLPGGRGDRRRRCRTQHHRRRQPGRRRPAPTARSHPRPARPATACSNCCR